MALVFCAEQYNLICHDVFSQVIKAQIKKIEAKNLTWFEWKLDIYWISQNLELSMTKILEGILNVVVQGLRQSLNISDQDEA